MDLRQVALLAPVAWRAWLNHQVAATDLLGPAPEGSVVVRADRVGGLVFTEYHAKRASTWDAT